MHVLIESLEISQDGEQATVRASLSQEYTPKGEKTMRKEVNAVFELTKPNGSWIIRDFH